jgi:peptidoglycan L-alanyl-D-glutamate endopeptidase CwlK
LLSRSASGQNVIHLQAALATAGCFSGNIDGGFGRSTEAAMQAFQTARALAVTGTLTQESAAALAWTRWTPPVSHIPAITVEHVARLLPQAPKANIEANLPPVLNALAAAGLVSRDMILMALATIRVETCLQHVPRRSGLRFI